MYDNAMRILIAIDVPMIMIIIVYLFINGTEYLRKTMNGCRQKEASILLRCETFS